MGEFEELESSKVLLQKCGEIFYDTLTVSDVNVSFQCIFCQKTFTKLDAFLEHFQSKHYKASTPVEEFCLLSDFEDVDEEKEILLTTEEDVNVSGKDEDSTSQLEFLLESAEGEMTSDHDSNILLPDENEKIAAHSKPQAENSKRGEHNCPHCCKVFKRTWDLKQHLHTHDGLKPYKCEHCPASFAWKSGLRVHEKRHKGEKPFIWRKRGEHNCPQCSKIFKKAWDLKEHLHIHDGLKPYKCEHCSASFACKSNLRAHEKRHDGERPFMCQFCSNSFLSAKQRRLHERSHTGERPFVCEFCGKSFSSSSGLQSHRSSQHLKERNFICGKCDKRFNRRSQLRLHQANMHTEKPRTHVCTICKAAFKDICVLKCHLTIHKEKTYQCLECGKKFANNSVFKRTWNLKQHLPIHDAMKPYKCEHCPASFVWKSGLKVHEKRHKDEKPFIWRKRGEHNCPQCCKVFKKAWDLKEHLHIHNGLKPYKCGHCSASFACKSNLRAHEKRHDGERPFVCQFCSSSFPSAKQQRCHERSHTGERPFVCEFCGKSFPFSSGLQSHRSSQHLKERNFICGKCDKRFNRPSQLRLHQKNMHTEKPRTHVCTICKAAFKDIYVLKGHLTIHKDKTYQCLECGKKFANNSGLYSHRKRHEKQRDRLLADILEQGGLK
uniref:C2H2-type domain-containing protein n=1 Tax=Glossina pallidipes TaxID=7398 RepID=A0A1A9ZLT6_GLOPL